MSSFNFLETHVTVAFILCIEHYAVVWHWLCRWIGVLFLETF